MINKPSAALVAMSLVAVAQPASAQWSNPVAAIKKAADEAKAEAEAVAAKARVAEAKAKEATAAKANNNILTSVLGKVKKVGNARQGQ